MPQAALDGNIEVEGRVDACGECDDATVEDASGAAEFGTIDEAWCSDRSQCREVVLVLEDLGLQWIEGLTRCRRVGDKCCHSCRSVVFDKEGGGGGKKKRAV